MLALEWKERAFIEKVNSLTVNLVTSFSHQKPLKSKNKKQDFSEYKVLRSCKVWAETNKKCKRSSKDALLGVLYDHRDVIQRYCTTTRIVIRIMLFIQNISSQLVSTDQIQRTTTDVKLISPEKEAVEGAVTHLFWYSWSINGGRENDFTRFAKEKKEKYWL